MSTIAFLATPVSIATFATAIGTFEMSLGSNGEGIIYSDPYCGLLPGYAFATSSGTSSFARSAIASAAAIFISIFIVVARTSSAPLKI